MESVYSKSYIRISKNMPPLDGLWQQILEAEDLRNVEVLFLLAPIFLELGFDHIGVQIYQTIANSDTPVSQVAIGALKGLGIEGGK